MADLFRWRTADWNHINQKARNRRPKETTDDNKKTATTRVKNCFFRKSITHSLSRKSIPHSDSDKKEFISLRFDEQNQQNAFVAEEEKIRIQMSIGADVNANGKDPSFSMENNIKRKSYRRLFNEGSKTNLTSKSITVLGSKSPEMKTKSFTASDKRISHALSSKKGKFLLRPESENSLKTSSEISPKELKEGSNQSSLPLNRRRTLLRCTSLSLLGPVRSNLYRGLKGKKTEGLMCKNLSESNIQVIPDGARRSRASSSMRKLFCRSYTQLNDMDQNDMVQVDVMGTPETTPIALSPNENISPLSASWQGERSIPDPLNLKDMQSPISTFSAMERCEKGKISHSTNRCSSPNALGASKSSPNLSKENGNAINVVKRDNGSKENGNAINVVKRENGSMWKENDKKSVVLHYDEKSTSQKTPVNKGDFCAKGRKETTDPKINQTKYDQSLGPTRSRSFLDADWATLSHLNSGIGLRHNELNTMKFNGRPPLPVLSTPVSQSKGKNDNEAGQRIRPKSVNRTKRLRPRQAETRILSSPSNRRSHGDGSHEGDISHMETPVINNRSRAVTIEKTSQSLSALSGLESEAMSPVLALGVDIMSWYEALLAVGKCGNDTVIEETSEYVQPRHSTHAVGLGVAPSHECNVNILEKTVEDKMESRKRRWARRMRREREKRLSVKNDANDSGTLPDHQYSSEESCDAPTASG